MAAAPELSLKEKLEQLLHSDEGKAQLEEFAEKLKTATATPEAQEKIAAIREKLKGIDKEKMKEGLAHLAEELEKPENQEKIDKIKDAFKNLDADKIKAKLEEAKAALAAANASK